MLSSTKDVITVRVSHGTLRGRRTSTISGSPLITFQGIPYAEPPVGHLRFKPPQPFPPWKGVRDAFVEGAVSPHYEPVTRKFVGSEDCLFLNVYTSKIPLDPMDPLRPVMVWIHGGGFTTGSGNTDLYGPDYLVEAGVVVVTFNYRLGVLGFLSLSNETVTGNMGLKDQVACLRWVQNNIAAFGGNPANVTIFGESSGASCVHLHMLSAMSRGLFHRAISQSGTALNWWALSRNPRERATLLGAALGCTGQEDSEHLLERLLAATPQQLVDAMESSRTDDDKEKGLVYTFQPCVEPHVKGEEGFLTELPVSLIKAGSFQQVPFIIGINSHEGIMMLKAVIDNPSLLSEIDGDFQRMVPKALKDAVQSPDKVRALVNRVKEFYFGDQPVSKDTILQYVDLNTDRVFAIDSHRTANLHAAAAPCSPIYRYQFCFDGGLNFFKKHTQGPFTVPGACHADDIGYLFYVKLLNLKFPDDSPEMKTVKRMVKLWTNFAKMGNPTPELDDDIAVRWTPYLLSNPCHLRIDTDLSLGGQIDEERMRLWDELYKAKL